MIKENIILVIFTLIHNRFSKKIKNRANSVDVKFLGRKKSNALLDALVFLLLDRKCIAEKLIYAWCNRLMYAWCNV